MNAKQILANIWNQYGETIKMVSEDTEVPVRLILAIIATESAGQAQAHRYEPNFYRKYIHGKLQFMRLPWYHEPERISASYGLMQLMYTTALAMGFPEEAEPETLYDPYTNIHFSCLYILHQKRLTNLDPVKVSAAYNSGGLRCSDEPPYYLHATKGHLERFMGYYNLTTEY